MTTLSFVESYYSFYTCIISKLLKKKNVFYLKMICFYYNSFHCSSMEITAWGHPDNFLTLKGYPINKAHVLAKLQGVSFYQEGLILSKTTFQLLRCACWNIFQYHITAKVPLQYESWPISPSRPSGIRSGRNSNFFLGFLYK